MDRPLTKIVEVKKGVLYTMPLYVDNGFLGREERLVKGCVIYVFVIMGPTK